MWFVLQEGDPSLALLQSGSQTTHSALVRFAVRINDGNISPRLICARSSSGRFGLLFNRQPGGLTNSVSALQDQIIHVVCLNQCKLD